MSKKSILPMNHSTTLWQCLTNTMKSNSPQNNTMIKIKFIC